MLLQKAVCGAGECSICGAQRKKKLETLESNSEFQFVETKSRVNEIRVREIKNLVHRR